jgi:hypothetical protein
MEKFFKKRRKLDIGAGKIIQAAGKVQAMM